MREVRVGVLGYGFVQREFHVPSYREIPDANVIAVGGVQRIDRMKSGKWEPISFR